ncbi:MAG: DUF4179 domain-containing protein [Oscillospiraceae bacterium]|nr:DUF4179 domain-containing protein [Oscillospiraceae bacterium]
MTMNNSTGNNVKEAIDIRLSGIYMSGELKDKIITGAATPNKKYRFKLTPAVVAVCLCIALAVPVFAVALQGYVALLGMVGPKVGVQLQPISMVSEDEGIKMEVVAAMNDDDSAVIFLTLQDQAGDRIDESVELLQYQVKSGDNYLSASAETVAFDETENIATIRLSAHDPGAMSGNINEDHLTVSIESFQSGKQEFSDIETGINLAEVTDDADTIDFNMNETIGRGASSMALLREIEEQSHIKALKPDELYIPIPGIDFAYISNIGIINGRLHVQMRSNQSEANTREWARARDSGYIALVADTAENVGDNDYFTTERDSFIHITRVEFSYYADEKGELFTNELYQEYTEDGDTYNTYYLYTECIYDASPDILADCKLMAQYFSTYSNYTECDLQAVFELTAIKESKSAHCDIDAGGIVFNSVTVSPFGVVMSGAADEAFDINVIAFVTMADGTTKDFGESAIGMTGGASGGADSADRESYFSSFGYDPDIVTSTYYGTDGEFILKYTCKTPLDIDSVVSVTINGSTIMLP